MNEREPRIVPESEERPIGEAQEVTHKLGSPSQYIERHTEEPLKPEEVTHAVEALERKIGIIEYQESGRARVESGAFSIEVAYEQNDEALQDAEPDKKGFLEIKAFQLDRSDRAASFTLKNIVPDDYRVFFYPHAENKSSYVRLESKRIVLFGDITQPSTILDLLHEAGHIHEQNNTQEFSPEEDHGRKAIYKEDLAKKLLSERNSWAFAFRKIKPFLDTERTEQSFFVKDDVKIFAKNDALKSYTDWAEAEATGRREANHMARDFWDDMDEFNYYSESE